jgi:F-type H+-transporting ATPase subunit epsilon
MAKLLSIDIVTPEKKIFEGKIRSIIAPGIDGEFGVLPDHTPFATILAPGVVTISLEDGKNELLAVSGGYVEVTREKVILLVETAERPEEVDIETVKRRKEEKEKLLRAKDRKDVDYDAIQISLMKEMSRLKALELLSKRKKA